MARGQVRTTVVLGAAYFANFGALAASAPFLALLLRDAGFSDGAAAEWLALFLLLRWVAIRGWTLLADRRGSVPRVLSLVTLGALASFAPLATRLPGALVVGCLAAFAIFRAPFGPLLDAFTLGEQANGGVVFGRVRAFGTAGYTLGALATGAVIAAAGSVGVVYAGVAFLVVAAIASFAFPSAPAVGSPPAPLSILAFVRRPRVASLFAIAALHQVGLAPYDGLFTAYLTPLAGAHAGVAAGVAVALGAGAELVFMIAGAKLTHRLGPRRVLRLACAGSAVRWATLGFTRSPLVLVAAQSLHALTFGAFYLASVALVDEECPAASRTAAQGIFSAWAFGVAAALGMSLAGVVDRAWGMPAVFRVGAVASLVAMLVPLQDRAGSA